MGHDCQRHQVPCYSFPHGCYFKINAVRRGEDLSAEGLELVGVGVFVRTDTSSGWRSADQVAPTFELSAWEVDAEDVALLAVLMGVGGQRDRFEFQGG